MGIEAGGKTDSLPEPEMYKPYEMESERQELSLEAVVCAVCGFRWIPKAPNPTRCGYYPCRTMLWTGRRRRARPISHSLLNSPTGNSENGLFTGLSYEKPLDKN